MAISKDQPMRPALIDLVDGYNGLQTGLEETNVVIGQLNRELGAEVERARESEQANARAIQDLASDVEAIPAMEYGAQNNIEVLAGGNATVNVSFPEAKESAPYVLVSLETAENDTTADCYAIITNVTNEGFNVRVHNKDTLNAIECTLYWIAIGE